MPWHDAQHRLTWTNDAGAVRPNHERPVLALIAQKITLYAHHVLGGNAIGNRADKLDPRICRLHDRIGAEGRRDESNAVSCPSLLYRFLHGIKYWKAEMRCPALARGNTADNIGAIGNHLLGVERALVA